MLLFAFRISIATSFATLQDLQQEFEACHSKCTSLLIELLQERQLVFGKHSECEKAFSESPKTTLVGLVDQKIADEFYDYLESKAFANLLLEMIQHCYEAFLKHACRDISFPVQCQRLLLLWLNGCLR